MLSSEVSGRRIDVCRSPADWAGPKRQCLWSGWCEGNRTTVEEPLLPHLEGAEAQQLWHGSWWWKGNQAQDNKFSVNKAERHILNENCCLYCLYCVDPGRSSDRVPWTVNGDWSSTQAESVCCRKEPFGKWRSLCTRQGLSSKDLYFYFQVKTHPTLFCVLWQTLKSFCVCHLSSSAAWKKSTCPRMVSTMQAWWRWLQQCDTIVSSVSWTSTTTLSPRRERWLWHRWVLSIDFPEGSRLVFPAHALSAVCIGSETPEEPTGGQFRRLPGSLWRSHRPRSSGQRRNACPQGKFTIRFTFYAVVLCFLCDRDKRDALVSHLRSSICHMVRSQKQQLLWWLVLSWINRRWRK